MEEGEYYAIETFGSTGRGRVIEDVSRNAKHLSFSTAAELEVGSFDTVIGRMLPLRPQPRNAGAVQPPVSPLLFAYVPRAPSANRTHLSRSHQSARALLKSIQRNFGTLPFCRRYLDRAGEKNYLLAVSRDCTPSGIGKS